MNGVGFLQKSPKATAAVRYTEAVSQRKMMEKRPNTLNMIRMQRECTIAPMKSRRQNIANIPENVGNKELFTFFPTIKISHKTSTKLIRYLEEP
jgi:hypothetical protein